MHFACLKLEEEKWVSDSEKPKILSIDNYFMSEQEQIISNINHANKKQIVMKYEYDETMDEAYQRSLVKSFKKTIDDDLFRFVLVDMINDKLAKLEEMSFYATVRGFQVYVIEVENDLELGFIRNEHARTQTEIKKVILIFRNLKRFKQ